MKGMIITMKRKIVTSCLVLIMAIVLSVCVHAEPVATGACGNSLTWSLDSEGILTISGTGEMANYASYSSVPWYSSRGSIKKVSISEGVTSIGNRAFYNCQEMQSVSIPQTVSEIGSYAFSGCKNLLGVQLPMGLTELGNRAFYNCQSIESITVPDGVTTLKNSTFAKCSSLSQVKLGSGISEIEDSAFEECESLTEVVLGESIEIFGEDIFSLCLEELTLVAYYDTPAAEYCYSQEYDYRIMCTVSFYSDSELLFKNECLAGSNLTLPENTYVKEGYNFKGWNINGTKYAPGDVIAVDKNLNIKALWEIQTFDVLLFTGTTQNLSPLVKRYGEDLILDIVPEREGYDFLGWSETENSQTVRYSLNSVFTENESTVLYAVWEYKTYTVEYSIPETGETIEGQVKLYGKALQLSDVIPKRSGYTFVGWSTKQEAVISEFSPGELYDIDESVVLYAVWTNGIIYGDADNNGKIDLHDLILMLKRINNFNIELTQDNILAMDVYKDSYFNMKDVLKLAQYLAGWTNVVLGE